ncbi:MAG: hypothetical protein ABH803_03615 [Candidatus Micrarchaeota archaeon]
MRDRLARKTQETVGTSDEVKTLDSKINLLAQRIATIEKNLEVVGRTMVALNDKIEKTSKLKLEEKGVDYAQLDKKFASREDFLEIKAIIEQINPLSFATINEVKELIEEKIEKANKK